jgi:two-component system response regulator HydG
MTSPATSGAAPTVLVVDDEAGILESLRILLRGEGWQVLTAQGGRAGLEQLNASRPDVVLSDIRMPVVDGVQLLAAVKQRDPDCPVILMTAQATLQSAVQAVNEGAFHYVQKPFRNDEIIALVRRALETRVLTTENRVLKQAIRAQAGRASSRPIGRAPAWVAALKVAETVAPTDATVLIQGESGTGKEVVARWIHELSGRTEHPFLSINCGALPESLLESELFGHVKGSFTGAVKDKAGLFLAAAKGTFFLDEIGETTPATQVKLLRVLQQREVIPVGATETVPIDTRLIAATNRDLEAEMKTGRFRSDLFYRLNVIQIHLPPLRDRRQDIPLLTEQFLLTLAAGRGESPKRMTSDATEVLQSYAWPGNVRELENALERAYILSDGPAIGVESLPERIVTRKAEPLVSDRLPANPTLEAVERAYINWVLQAEGGNKTRAAEVLDIDPSTLNRKLARYSDQNPE